MHDFPQDAKGKAIPYGIYDMGRNEAWVNIGRAYDTPAFAVASSADGGTRWGSVLMRMLKNYLLPPMQEEATAIAHTPGSIDCRNLPMKPISGSELATFHPGPVSEQG